MKPAGNSVLRHSFRSRYRSSIDQIQQGKQVDPDNVHKVPVEARNLKRRVIFRSKSSFPSHPGDHSKDADADEHVDCMHPSQSEIE